MTRKPGLILSAMLLVLGMSLLAGCGSKGTAVQGTDKQQGNPPASTTQNTGQKADGSPATTGPSQPLPPDKNLAPRTNGESRLQNIALALDMTVDEVRSYMQAGKSLTSLVQEKGFDQDQVVQKLLELEKARLEEDVQGGRISQEQADQMLADMKARGLAAWEWVRPQGPAPQKGQQSQPDASKLP
ncbi:hypothetical protein E308F_05280 [Moorella sp. E308F]|uniref:sigma-70 domain-containing protein n=1 Tax=Moorella sp. E308F TaxID=2572682 RepID=UPI0010FFAADF|nr:sigma-70 domain-containing protein [Moorella sp. E308F]GEA14286.1 hypothetical protein E308F_05280 [Moorella sp. E308F]